MAYDQALAQRIRHILADYDAVVEKCMFGGISFLLRGNFVCGLTKRDLVVRVGPERYAEALAHPHTREMDFTGRPMNGWVSVNSEGYASDEALADRVKQGPSFALSLPPKKPRKG
ncbi:MAG: TfoX/Sxy family protein [Chloroflexi bacterium]|nr:TfoX/Sxy family protein [Chloroflexota bacterium]